MTYHRDRPEAPQPACARLDTRTADELFFAHHLSHEARAARNICGTCPLILQCRQYADEHETKPYPAGHDTHGIWGGETTDQRKARRANRTPRLQPDRIADEEAAWSMGEARSAATAYRNGDRSAWATTGQRVYDRRARRAARARAAA